MIGYVSVLPTKRVPESVKVVESFPKEAFPPKLEKIPELETIEEVNSWFDEKYPFKMKLLETGEGFHGDEIDAKNGETWLGLFEERGQFYLRPTKLKIKRVYDPIVDEDVKKKTGKNVKVNTKNESIFLVKNADFLSEGKVQTLFKGVTWNEYSDSNVFTYIRKDFNQQVKIEKEHCL